jgi:hypothetical protein
VCYPTHLDKAGLMGHSFGLLSGPLAVSHILYVWHSFNRITSCENAGRFCWIKRGSLMDEKVTGAWLLHHSLKLQQVTGGQDFNNVNAAGKAGTLLSALSSNDQTSLDRAQVEVTCPHFPHGDLTT